MTSEQIAQSLAAALPLLDPTEQGIAVGLLRLLAQGGPVRVEDVAGRVGLPVEQVRRALDSWPGIFRDDEARVIGYFGLTVPEMGAHRLHVDGRALSAWCAWDTLFLPELLGRPARVTSRCPITGEPISLQVDRAGVSDLEPEEAVVSLLVPQRALEADLIQTFCHHIHFFASPEAGERWTAEHDGTFLMSVAQAHDLGRRTNAAVFGAVLGLGPPVRDAPRM